MNRYSLAKTKVRIIQTGIFCNESQLKATAFIKLLQKHCILPKALPMSYLAIQYYILPSFESLKYKKLQDWFQEPQDGDLV